RDTGWELAGRFRDALTPIFMLFCLEHNITIMTAAIDKYGSYVWEGGQAGSLNWYITLAMTPTTSTDTPSDSPLVYVMSVLVGADDGYHFTSRAGSEWTLEAADLLHYIKSSERVLPNGLDADRKLLRERGAV